MANPVKRSYKPNISVASDTASMVTRAWWPTMLGLLLILAGLFALLLPQAATLALNNFYGVLLLIVGVIKAGIAWREEGRPGFWSAVAASFFAFAAGLMLLLFPLAGMITMTLVFALFFLVQGIAKMSWGSALRPMHPWGWLIVGGVVDLLFGAFALWGLPATALWVVGVFFGISLIYWGVTMLMLPRLFANL